MSAQIRQFIEELSRSHRFYREVRGDGNCFFRSVAVEYFSLVKPRTVHEAFPDLQRMRLCVSGVHSIPEEVQPFY